MSDSTGHGGTGSVKDFIRRRSQALGWYDVAGMTLARLEGRRAGITISQPAASAYCLTNLRGEPNFWIGWLYCLLLGLAINFFHDSRSKPIKVAAEKVALYSYGMYLLHVPVLYLVFMVLGIKNLVFGPLLFVALTMVASSITYHFLESPLIEIGRKLSFPQRRSQVSLPVQEGHEPARPC